jgi:uncharacterized repeat protein (TIGR04052 family)
MFNPRFLTLVLPLLAFACQPARSPVEIEFDVRYGADPIRCTTSDDGVSLSDARFFVHDVYLLTALGDSVPVEMTARPPWQTADVALLDFEDGSGECRNGSREINTRITGLAPDGDYRGVTFTVGVPEFLNHSDPLRANAPLTITAMHWHWRSGYKFMRAGIRQGDDGAWLHLGSTRCEGVIGDLQGCAFGNRPTVKLEGLAPATQQIILDLQTLFAAARLDDGKIEGCEMGPDETACGALLPGLGLDPDSGTSRASASAFRAAARE